MTTARAAVTTDWTMVVDFTGKWVQYMTISREQDVECLIGFGNEAPSEPEFTLTHSFIGIESRRVPSGSKLWAKVTTGTADVVVNYD